MIRKLKIEDLGKVNLLLNQFNYNITLDSFNNPFFNALIYEEKDIHGVLVYNLLYDRIEIEYIAVNELYKNKGIGTKLLKSVEKSNIKNITLEVKKSNKSAIEFYKKNGYNIASIRKNYYNGEDGYLMLKEIGE